jgi:hypothetical protein
LRQKILVRFPVVGVLLPEWTVGAKVHEGKPATGSFRFSGGMMY